MVEFTFDYIRSRFTQESQELFLRMVETHLETRGDRFFILATSSIDASLIFSRDSNRNIADVDPGALEDLAEVGLLRWSRPGRDPNYRVTPEGLRFHRWLLEQEGAPVEQPQIEALRLVEGERFARAHASASKHLGDAFSLLRSGRDDDQTTSQIGSHLRNAVFDLVSDLAGDDGGKQEKPLPRLKSLVESAAVSERERRVLDALVELADSVLWLDQRVTHSRDEADKEIPLRGWDEVQRATTTTAFLCAEMDRALANP